MIKSEKWDYVVIQEIFNAREQEFQDYAAKFDDLIRQSGSKTIIFATASVTEYYSASFRYPDAFKKLNDMQVSFGKAWQLAVFPSVGFVTTPARWRGPGVAGVLGPVSIER